MLQNYASFVGLCLGFFIVIMDMSTVPLTYTTLMDLFNVSPAKVAWINNIYLISYAAFLLLGGRLGDFANRKYIVLTSYLAIGIGAAISGAGQTFQDVLLGRALMGVGAGLMTPQSMAYISILFSKGSRGTALGIWGTVAGIATATGPVITQIFLTTADWRWVMWVNIPIALVCFLIGAWNLPNAPGAGIKSWDTAVSGLCGTFLAAAIVGIQLINVSSSAAYLGVALIVFGSIGTGLLIRNELRIKAGYILSQELWLDSVFLRTCLISGMLGLGVTAFYLPLVFLLDLRMSFGPVLISSILMTAALSNALVGPFAGNISDRVEPEKIVSIGLVLFAIANVLLGLISVFIPGGMLAFIAIVAVMVISGAGTGLAFAPLANIALGRTRPTSVGRAAAFFSCVRQVSSALGGVIVSILFETVIRLQLEPGHVVTATSLRQSTNATSIAILSCFLFIALSLGAAAYLCRNNNEEEIYRLAKP